MLRAGARAFDGMPTDAGRCGQDSADIKKAGGPDEPPAGLAASRTPVARRCAPSPQYEKPHPSTLAERAVTNKRRVELCLDIDQPNDQKFPSFANKRN
jgi:hypothetical protein